MIKTLSLFLILFSVRSFAYVISKTDAGSNVKWLRSGAALTLVANTTPVDTNMTLDISETALLDLNMTKSQYISNRTQEIINSSIEQWSVASPFELKTLFTSSLPSVGSEENTFRYSDDYSYFGAGVIAVTTIAYNADTGVIFSTDILMNQSPFNLINLTLDKRTSSKNNAFIGDVITHEVGHLLGLSHSEVINSTMVYSVFKNQHTIHEDDIAGLRKNYDLKALDGSLKGKVVAGDDSLPIFGSHVQVISTKSNDVVQSQVTDDNGEFFIDNLDINDSYYVLVSPLKNLSSLSDYYKNVNNQLCGQVEYKPTFYSKCGARDKGRPQVFKLSSSVDHLDIGSITIRCDENLNTEYFGNKYKTTDRQFNLLQNYSDSSAVFNGYFSSDEISIGDAGLGDEFLLDLSTIDVGDQALDSLLVNIDLNASGFGSIYEFKLYSRIQGSGSWDEHISTKDDTGKKLIDLNIRLGLSTTSSKNIFELKVVPIALSSEEQYEIFAAPETLKAANNLYTISTSIGYYIGSTFNAVKIHDSYPYEDNSSCVEGSVTYQSSSYIPLNATGGNAAQSDDEDLGVSCGTIDIDGDSNSSGMGSFVLGFFMILLFLKFQSICPNSLSKY